MPFREPFYFASDGTCNVKSHSMRLSSALSGSCRRLPIRWSLALALAALFTSLALTGQAQTIAAQQREFAIKAAFLLHFTQFIVWPPEALPAPGQPMKIGILAPNPFGNLLAEMVRDDTVEGRAVQVVEMTTIEEAEKVQILFIPRDAPRAQREGVAKLRGEPVLLVGEDPAFLRQAGMVALVRERERIVIMVNREALEEAGLSANSRLLRIAKTVGDSSDE